jgi:penicillin-binding protein 2
MSVLDAQAQSRARLGFFYGAVAAMVVVLFSGLAYRQLLSGLSFTARERLQNQRRILLPGPRGEILDREGRVLVANRSRFSAVMFFSDARVRREFRRAYLELRRDGVIKPEDDNAEDFARAYVVQRYLNECNRILGRNERISTKKVNEHFLREPLLPFAILEDLGPDEFARLLEQLPAASPVQIISSVVRHYPYGRAAAHTLGYVSQTPELPTEDLPGEDLKTFNRRGTFGREGLEYQFDTELQGKTGSEIYVVDPAGYKVDLVENTPPITGEPLHTSLDIDLQLAGEGAFGDQEGACVAIDVRSGEVLAQISRPDYDLNSTTPFISSATFKDINERGAFLNRATQGHYPPGSTYKIIGAIAGLRNGTIAAQSEFSCAGTFKVGNHVFPCHNRRAHGSINVVPAIAKSCNVFFYQNALALGPERLAAEARRFGLDRPTGIELPSEGKRMVVPDPDWKRNQSLGGWVAGDTANTSIGQGFVLVTPLQMACFTASFARNETITTPTILRRLPGASPALAGNQSVGLTTGDRAAIVAGMEAATQKGGTATKAAIPGIRLAAKTGTAQKDVYVEGKKDRLNFAWTIVFGPIEYPTIAVAVVVSGDLEDDEYGGGTYAAPIAKAVLEAYFAKHPPLTAPPTAEPLTFGRP